MYKYFDITNLPRLSSDRRVMQTSSYDRQYENADWGQYLYEKDDKYILFDTVGCGCIKSIWMAVTNEATKLEFFFDGEDTPRWTTSTKGLFNGDIPELIGIGCSFEERGHYDEDDCHAGNCFIEIPFDKGLRIEASGEKKVFYHILYETYADGNAEMHAVGTNDMEKSFEGSVILPENLEIFEADVTIKKGYTTFFTKKDCSGVIREFTIDVPADCDLTEIFMDISYDWEDFRISQVGTPLSHLFAQPTGMTDVASHVVTSKEVEGRRILSLYLPMPFWKSCSFCFVKHTEGTVDVKVKVATAENTYDKENTGYFHADFHLGDTQLFGDWEFGIFGGRGQVVGFVQTCIGGQYCEGNEHFYIDGELSPSINGTGTEDLYLACYWPNSKFDSPVAGCLNDVFIDNGSTLPGAFLSPIGYYRYFLDCPIAFENGIRLYIQHGAVNQTYSHYTSLTLSYRIDEPSLFETDIINLESEASMMLHAFTTDGELYDFSGKLESDMFAPLMHRKGYKTVKGDSIIFKAAIHEDNKGAVIRRLYDQSISNKGAEVYIDGEFAGVWNCAGINPNFPLCDSDFHIPASLTKGKSLIDVEIRVTDQFSDFEYRILSRR